MLSCCCILDEWQFSLLLRFPVRGPLRILPPNVVISEVGRLAFLSARRVVLAWRVCFFPIFFAPFGTPGGVTCGPRRTQNVVVLSNSLLYKNICGVLKGKQKRCRWRASRSIRSPRATGRRRSDARATCGHQCGSASHQDGQETGLVVAVHFGVIHASVAQSVDKDLWVIRWYNGT